ncbi:MAG: GNAT family N-acetyltransferase [Clostridia bacterium]|nr:GNAT family N-acetyltransferase [Clostridia bacterium]
MITGSKVAIRGLTKEDSANIYEWVNKEELRALTGTLYPVSEYEHEEWIRRTTTSGNTKLFLVFEKVSGKKLGTIGLKNFDYTNRNVELFISLGISGGFGTDAVKTLTDYCFAHLNIHKVYLYVFESNQRAVRCYEKAGFINEGTLSEHHFNNYNYESVIVMGRLNKTKQNKEF